MRKVSARRLIAGAAAASLLAGIAAVAGTANAADMNPVLDWSVPDRVTGRQNGLVDNVTPSRAFINPARWPVILSGCRTTGGNIKRFDFSIRRPDGGQDVVSSQPGECVAVYDAPVEDTYQVQMVAIADDGSTATAATAVVVNDVLVVSMGDSLASGEGNPDRVLGGGNVQWYDRNCHRSGFAGPARAALKLERADPHTSVTFVSLACSGASITNGLIGGHRGNISQIEGISNLLCPAGRTCNSKEDIRNIDALMLQVGANDIRFDEIVDVCASLFDTIDQDCFDDDEIVFNLFHDLRALPGKFDQLNQVMGDWLRYSNVYLPDYFDPTTNDNGNTCNSMDFRWGIFNGTINRNEAVWALNEVVTPLNNILVGASQRHRWQSLDFIVERFRGHGYCAHNHFIVQFAESNDNQGDRKGTMHPNGSGHGIYQDRLFEAARPLLGS